MKTGQESVLHKNQICILCVLKQETFYTFLVDCVTVVYDTVNRKYYFSMLCCETFADTVYKILLLFQEALQELSLPASVMFLTFIRICPE